MRYTLTKIPDDEITFSLTGSFTFRDHDSFFEFVNMIKAKTYSKVTLDFSGCDFIDSAALGMLVILSDEIVSKNKKTQKIIFNAAGKVKDVLLATRMDSLYEITD